MEEIEIDEALIGYKFDVGDVAVFPGTGVGKIKFIETREYNGKEYEIYVLNFFSGDTEIDVPVESAILNGLRPIITLEKIDEILVTLLDREFEINKQTWNRRYREYTQKLATGSVIEICKVFRDLALIKVRKSLSFGERKMYDQAHGLLIEEIAHVRLKEYETGVRSGTTEIQSKRRVKATNEESLLKHFEAHLDVLRTQATEDIAEQFRKDEEEEAIRRQIEENNKKERRSNSKKSVLAAKALAKEKKEKKEAEIREAAAALESEQLESEDQKAKEDQDPKE